MISQEYFDEVCIENRDLFDLTEEDAVEETVKQLSTTSSSCLDHLSLTFPNEQNQKTREERRKIMDALENLTDLELIESQAATHMSLLISVDAVGKLTSAWTGQPQITRLLLKLIQKDTIRSFQNNFRPIVWLENFEQTQDIVSWLDLACFSIRQNEDVKKAWMNAKTEKGKGIVDVLVDIMDDTTIDGCCRFITLLCTFDDFRPNNSGAPKVSSANDNVQTLYQANFVPKLIKNIDKSTAVIAALRAMAIQDDIIQSMVAFGILEKATSIFRPENSVDQLTNTIGLFRNLSANDQIKTSLCTGDTLVAMHEISQLHLDEEALQEHVCGTVAAMALRQPKNAELMVTNGLHTLIFRAMRKHPDRVTLQRQGALAIRNLVSRSQHLRKQLIDDGAEDVLRMVAARHIGCQDEVYAALRDLGLQANMIQYEEDSSGNIVVKARQMFGEKNPNFRPVYD